MACQFLQEEACELIIIRSGEDGKHHSETKIFRALSGRKCRNDINQSLAIRFKHLIYWSGRRDSNSRPLAPHASALPGCATPRPRHAQSSCARLWCPEDESNITH